MSAERAVLVVVSLQPLDATTTLFFEHVAACMPGRIRIPQPRSGDMARALSEAAAVVLVRGLFEFPAVSRSARVLQLPIYYFTDDNFMVLRQQPGLASRFVARYSLSNVRRALRDCSGVLLASTPLLEYFAVNELHSHLVLYPPAASQPIMPTTRAATERLRVAFFGGVHLHDFFFQTVLPGVRRAAFNRPITLILMGVTVPLTASAGLEIIQEPYQQSYSRGIGILAQLGVDVLLHPVAPGLASNDFKNPHALITANALGAIPIVSSRPPYESLRAEGVALFGADSEDSWKDLLLQAADEQTASPIRARLSAFCAARFSGRENVAVISAILDRCPPPTRWGRSWRKSVIYAVLLMSRIAGMFGSLMRTHSGDGRR